MSAERRAISAQCSSVVITDQPSCSSIRKAFHFLRFQQYVCTEEADNFQLKLLSVDNYGRLCQALSN
jgi:hypothetical protein